MAAINRSTLVNTPRFNRLPVRSRKERWRGLREYAFKVSDDGSTIVGFSSSSSGSEAYRWTSSGGMQGLGDLSGGIFQSGAYDITGDGATIVGRATSASCQQAFRWTSSGGMQGLGDLSGGSFNSFAKGISGDGSTIVGFSCAWRLAERATCPEAIQDKSRWQRGRKS
ncbi:MAG: hypothetical protein ABIP55_10875 [Tepidisphaeraceae bacterium]